MKNFFSSLALAVAACLGAPGRAQAQQVTVAAGTLTSAISPINHANPDGVWECIYLQSQLNQAGQITQLAFEKLDGTNVGPLDGVTVYLKTTTATQFTAGPIDSAGYQRVFRGSFPNATPSGYQVLTLAQPFAYNNTENLSVLIIRRGGTNRTSAVSPAANSRARYAYGIVTGRDVCRRYNSAVPISNTTQLTPINYLSNLRLTFGTPTGTRGRALGATAALYPSPATEFATLDVAGLRGAATLAILDVLGRQVRPAAALPAGVGSVRVSVGDLAPGPYLLRVRTAEQQLVLRLVRE